MKLTHKVSLLGAVALAALGSRLALANPPAQNVEDVAPQVVAVQPYPGEEMRLDQPLTLFFNQAMDRRSLEAAWDITPDVEGQFQWNDDQTAVFIPKDGWTRGESYQVAISTTATAANGLALPEEYKFTIRAVGELVVSSVIPSPDATGVAADATITVAFNRPVVPLVSTEDLENLPNPLVIEPEIKGKGEWLNTSIYQFTPEEALLGGATYSVTIKAGLTDFTGAVLEEDYRFQFQTLLPEILYTYPSEGGTVLLDEALQVTFSQPMNQAVTQEAFRLLKGDQPVAGTFTWSDDGTSLTFTPAERLAIASSYRLQIDAATAKGLGGANLRDGRDFTFSTVSLPYVAYTYPANGETGVYPGAQSVSIEFGTPMNMDTLEGKIEIEPEVEWTPYVYGNSSFAVSFEMLPNTRYTITLKAGAEDIYGNPIRSHYSFSFMTGEVEPYVYMQDNGQLVTTGAYRPNTVILMQVTGEPLVNFALYSVPLEHLRDVAWYQYDEASIRRLADESRLVRRWDQTLKGGNYTTVPINLASDGGGALAPGIYYLTANHRQPDWNNVMSVGVAVVNASITYKRMEGGILVWVTDMQTGEPLADQDVTIYQDGRAVAHGTTDDEGVWKTDLDPNLNHTFLAIESKGGDKYGVWYNSGAPITSADDMYIYTDRPIYRPGETVYYRGIYRARQDVNYTPGGVETLHLFASINYGQQILLEQDVTLNEFGAFSGEIVLPEDVPIGVLSLEVRKEDYWIGQVDAQISEFRVPEFEVSVTPDQDEIIGGDPLRAAVKGSFFSGGTVSNAPVTWSASAYKTSFFYKGGGNYTFSDVSDPYYYFYDYEYGYDSYAYDGYRFVSSGEGVTDAEGSFLIEIPGELTTPGGPYPEQVTVEATLSDESGQYISNRSSVTVHPSEVYVGIATEQYFGQEGEPFEVSLITVTPQSEIVPNQNVDLFLIERRWERIPIEGQFGRYTWEQSEIEVEKVRITTDENGLAKHTFTPPNAGTFIIRAETRDGRERLHRSERTLWVTGSTFVWWGQPSNDITLIADKDGYKAGDTAEILVPVSLQGTSYLLISVERDGVMSYQIVAVEGSTYVYHLPITDEYAPTIYVSVVVMHGIDQDNAVPTYRTGTLALSVDPASKRLDVTVTPSAKNAQPGDTVTFDIEARQPNGEPAQAEIGVAMVDAAILTLTAPNSTDPEAHYYGYASNYTVTDTLMNALIDGRLEAQEEQAQEEKEAAARDEALATDGAFAGEAAAAPALAATATPEGLGGGPDFNAVEVRTDFQQTPLWEPSVRTDASGRAQLSVTLPDNLTRWNVKTRALTVDTLVGADEIEIASTLPLLVRPATPRFFVVGDEVSLAMVINNNSGQAQTVQTTMQGSGFELLEGETLQKAVEIAADDRARVEWRVKILDVTAVDLTFIAVGEDGYQDASKPPLATGENGTIPVYRYTAPDTVGTGGVLREAGSTTEGVTIPPIADTDQGDLTLKLDPSLAVTTLDALDYLQNFPHQCIEQTVSRFLPNVMTYRALKQLGVEDAELERKLRLVMDEAIAKLRQEQNSDGGWGWFTYMRSDPLVSAYALLGLAEARNVGYDVSTDMISRAAVFVRSSLIIPTEDTEPYLLNRQAFFLYALARYPEGKPARAELDALFSVRLEMSQYAKAYLLLAYAEQSDAGDPINALYSDLITAARLSATGAHWEEDYTDWWNWNTDVRTTSIVLSALLKANPNYELLPNAVRWLMVARQGDHWTTTQETAWAVMGLTDWMVATNELQGNYTYNVALNGAEAGSGSVTPETVRQGQTLTFAVKDLLLDQMNRVTIVRGEGEGALYYTAHLRLRLDASEVDAINRGVGITREYFREDGESVTEASMGDVLTVRLTITIPDTIYYFVLEDPLPAGTEALDTSLLTTTTQIEGPQLAPAYDPYYWWGWWYFDHTEIRDEQVNLYADVLPPGTYVYSYQVQATTPGKFQTMPAHGYAFYFPEVFGRSDGTLFTVNE